MKMKLIERSSRRADGPSSAAIPKWNIGISICLLLAIFSLPFSAQAATNRISDLPRTHTVSRGDLLEVSHQTNAGAGIYGSKAVTVEELATNVFQLTGGGSATMPLLVVTGDSLNTTNFVGPGLGWVDFLMLRPIWSGMAVTNFSVPFQTASNTFRLVTNQVGTVSIYTNHAFSRYIFSEWGGINDINNGDTADNTINALSNEWRVVHQMGFSVAAKTIHQTFLDSHATNSPIPVFTTNRWMVNNWIRGPARQAHLYDYLDDAETTLTNNGAIYQNVDIFGSPLGTYYTGFNTNYVLASDGVHCNALGNWLVASNFDYVVTPFGTESLSVAGGSIFGPLTTHGNATIYGVATSKSTDVGSSSVALASDIYGGYVSTSQGSSAGHLYVVPASKSVHIGDGGAGNYEVDIHNGAPLGVHLIGAGASFISSGQLGVNTNVPDADFDVQGFAHFHGPVTNYSGSFGSVSGDGSGLLKTLEARPIDPSKTFFLFLGDSHTAGVNNYWYWLTNNPMYAGVTTVNMAVGGTTSQDTLDGISTNLFAYTNLFKTKAGFVFLWTGANDYPYTQFATNYIRNLTLLCSNVYAAGASNLTLFTITGSTGGVANDQSSNLMTFNTFIRTNANTGMYDNLVDVNQRYPNPNWDRLDGVHFPTNIHYRISGMVDQTLRRGKNGFYVPTSWLQFANEWYLWNPYASRKLITVTTNPFVGIGTDGTPTFPLVVKTPGDNNSSVTMTSDIYGGYIGTSLGSGASHLYFTPYSKSVHFGDGGAGNYELDIHNGGPVGVHLIGGGASYINGGNLGLGTTSPGATLDANGGIRSFADSTPASGIGLEFGYNGTFGGRVSAFDRDTASIVPLNLEGAPVIINGTNHAKLGVGTNGPVATVHVIGNGAQANLVQAGTTSTDNLFNVSTNGYVTAQKYLVVTMQVVSGAGSPESAVTAPAGSIYLRNNGGAGTTFYVKESGSGNTGWVAK